MSNRLSWTSARRENMHKHNCWTIISCDLKSHIFHLAGVMPMTHNDVILGLQSEINEIQTVAAQACSKSREAVCVPKWCRTSWALLAICSVSLLRVGCNTPCSLTPGVTWMVFKVSKVREIVVLNLFYRRPQYMGEAVQPECLICNCPLLCCLRWNSSGWGCESLIAS